MKIISSTIIAAVAAMAFASCDSDNSKDIVQYGYDKDVTYVTDLNTNTTTELAGANYILELDLVNAKANVDITNLRLDETGTPVKLRIEQAKLGYNAETGATVITAANAVSVVGGVSHTISNFKLSQTIVYITALGGQTTYYSISYTVDNRYNVTAVQTGAYLPGTTVITDNATGNELAKSTRPYYMYVLDREKSKATLVVYGVTIDNVTYRELSFENLPYSLTPFGISINVDEDVIAKQLTADGKPFVAKAINMQSQYDGATQIRILTDSSLLTASLSYRVQ